MFKQLHVNITLADALILMPKYQKMLKGLRSNKEKLQELANTPLNENCSAVILKNLPEKLRDPGKFLIPCSFSELKCKALADLGASINLMPLSVWKKLGLPKLISTRMTLELASRAICTPAGIARDVFVSVGKFTFPAYFFIVDYESDPRVSLILGRPFLRIARALIDVHGEEMILYTMSDQRTMAELLRAPTEGYAEAIAVPLILAEQFELKHSLINMMTSDQFFGLKKDNPHDHIRAACRWLEKEPPCSILTWEDLIQNLLRACPHHGFTELHQLDTFYNALNPADQDSLNSAVGGNLLERRTQDVLTIIENKSKLRNSQNKSVDSQVESSDANSNSSFEIAKLTHAVDQQTSAVTTAMTAILKQFQATPHPASVKAVEEICVTCGGAHPYYQCLAADGNTFPELRDNIQGYVAAAAINYNQGNSVYRPSVVPLSELEKVKRMNEANMKAMKTQINNVKNELRNEMKNSIQASINTIANPKGKLKAITTQSGIVFDGPSVPTLPPFINPEVGERVEETLTDQDLAEYTIKVPSPLVQKSKPPSQRDFVVHQKDPLHPNIPYPSRMLKQKQQEKDKKMLKDLLSNKEKLQELANTPLNENCSAVILKKLPEKLRDPGKFLILCGFNELKCKALANLGVSINLMPLSVWKNLGLPKLISTRMTLELANRAICTPAGIARDVFVPVGKFTFLANFVIVDYESDLRVPFILGRPFLRTARALIDVHGEEMILHDGDERLTLNMRHDTSSYSNQPQKESINLINVFNDSNGDFLEDLFAINHQSGNHTFSCHPILTSSKVKDDIFDPEGGNVLPKKLLDLDSTKDLHPPHYIDSILKDSMDQSNLADLNDNIVNSMPEMFTDEHAFDYSSPPLYDEYNDDLFEVDSDTENVYNDPFDSKGEKIKESKLLIDELDLPYDFLLPFEYDSILSEDFSKGDALPSTINEDKVFNPGILIQENFFKVITHVAPEKKDKKLAISYASLMLEDFDHPLYELPFFKEVSRPKMLLSFSSKKEEKIFKPGIHTSRKVHSSLIPELSHQGYTVFKINQIFKSPMKIFLFSYRKDTHILAVPYLYFYPLTSSSMGELGQAKRP
uniref:Reverse transcriptase domain-containing protein n=1 Tax=Tanacetum cinerariifolium TaxID=118510 RepID=A0A699HYP6_TANCI|nr:hypothetical protein [Tanacetum cinerariifolium]